MEHPAGDPTTEFAKEVARQLPIKQIYEDAAAPASKQAGQFLSDLVKTIQLALVPVQFLAAYQDRVRHFIDTSVRTVPEDKRIAPPPQILGPVLEGIRYEPSGTPLDEMFSELLAKSMHTDEHQHAHPAYPLIIRQLSSDEARVLKVLKHSEPAFVWSSPLNPLTNLFGDRTVELDEFPRERLQQPANLSFYIDHLHQLGLAGIFQDGHQEALRTDGRQAGTRVRSRYRLTSIGRSFAAACIRD